ncbi:hypothetical protein ACP70R_038992 [Stipagrostis hirtigluma subsp. patula]
MAPALRRPSLESAAAPDQRVHPRPRHARHPRASDARHSSAGSPARGLLLSSSSSAGGASAAAATTAMPVAPETARSGSGRDRQRVNGEGAYPGLKASDDGAGEERGERGRGKPEEPQRERVRRRSCATTSAAAKCAASCSARNAASPPTPRVKAERRADPPSFPSSSSDSDWRQRRRHGGADQRQIRIGTSVCAILKNIVMAKEFMGETSISFSRSLSFSEFASCTAFLASAAADSV